MTTIYLTRHGETEWNVRKKMQGWNDSPLTEKGIAYAQALGKSLQYVHFDAVFSSTSGRALSTTQHILGDRTFPIQTDERLKEMHLGDWEGRTQEEVKQHDATQLDYFWSQPTLYTPETGESYMDLYTRVLPFLHEIVEKYPNGTILLVTHAITLKSITRHYKNLPYEQIWDDPYIHGTSLTVFTVKDDNVTFLKDADMSHIEDFANEITYR
ncbi:histidine phosphatase family protein [Priestia taiwanensis]|uniref:Phosphatase n=1 Tax=Priestia taiwanensis TaxID=1347902 RepID=A0A917ERF8_9BACI|nr:histidine phosphatase family protein [Priestia taiwanensis]MBM7363937.1 putative phosphoglycerate mutase [Priestia taiwanensis]GGE70312.1 phosphatase [Priestia taiwanensis]